MSMVIITVGVPSSGKSTFARQYVKDNPGTVISCRDDIRIMQGLKSGENENLITKIQQGMIESAINDGMDVVVADCNANQKFRNQLIKFCHQRGADVEIKRFHISLDEAIMRDANRVSCVGADVVKRFHDMLAVQDVEDDILPAPVWEKYEHKGTKAGGMEYFEDVVIFDIDGTVARHVSRSPYDYTRVSEDEPIEDVLSVAGALSSQFKIIFVSGREYSCRSATIIWLRDHGIDFEFDLFMRKTKDQRPDYVIKNEIYDAEIIPKYNIVMVFDDRDQVVYHLRQRGITVAQVAPGRF